MLILLAGVILLVGAKKTGRGNEKTSKASRRLFRKIRFVFTEPAKWFRFTAAKKGGFRGGLYEILNFGYDRLFIGSAKMR
jgi:hypothetical protein